MVRKEGNIRMISNKNVILPFDMDNECIELCEKLNSLSHVETFESCCGHLKNRYMIFFWCDNFVRLAKLYRCVNRNYSDGKWEILVDGSDVRPIYGFLLRSIEPFKTTKEMMESIHYLIENIDIWENPKFNEYFESNNY